MGAPKGNHNHLKHGGRYTRLYYIWKTMRQRCNNPNCTKYGIYGQRGVTICDEWNDFAEFRKWALSSGYTDNLTIDRIDVNGNYEPSNCRWATAKEQSNNRRNTFYLECYGERHNLDEWSKITGIGAKLIWERVYRGWSAEKALTTPVRKSRKEA